MMSTPMCKAVVTCSFCRRSHWLQCGDSYIQKHQIPSMGFGGADEYPAILAVLLPQHTGVLSLCNDLLQIDGLHAAGGSSSAAGTFIQGTIAAVPQAIIYVVDSSDTERIGISREEFHNILSEDELSDALILVYANKQVHTTTIQLR